MPLRSTTETEEISDFDPSSDVDFESYEEISSEQDFEDAVEDNCKENNEELHADQLKRRLDQKESRREQKVRKLERQSSKRNFDLLQSLKKLWEKARQQHLSSAERKPVIDEMFNITHKNVVDLIFKHDASRIIQTIVKYGNESQRNSVASELKSKFPILACGKYSKHLVEKLLKLCPSKRNEIISEFKGKVKKLLGHKEASQVLETIYLQYTNAKQKRFLLQEFYGSEYRIFGDGTKTFQEIILSFPEKKSSILENLLFSITAALNKGILSNCLLHHVILEYLQNASSTQIDDLFSSMREQIVEMMHTHLGYKIALICIANSSAKDRKVLLKSFKPFVSKILQEEFGHLVIIGCMLLVDDTVLMEKLVLNELCEDIKKLYQNQYAKKVILLPFSGLSKKHYDNVFVTFMDELISTSSEREFSKKPTELKLAELKAFLTPAINTLLLENPSEFIVDQSLSSIALEIGTLENLIIPLKKPFSSPEHVLKNPNGGFFYKRLIQKNPEASVLIFEAVGSYICALAIDPMTCYLVLTLFNEQATSSIVLDRIKSIKDELKTNNDSRVLTLYNRVFPIMQ